MTDCSSHCGDVTSFLSCIYMLLFCVLIQFLSFPNLSLSCTFMTKEEEFSFVNSVLANKVHDKQHRTNDTNKTNPGIGYLDIGSYHP